MRIVFVNRYFYPDHSATSQMLADLAFHLAARGWDVGVITSRLRYEDAPSSAFGTFSPAARGRRPLDASDSRPFAPRSGEKVPEGRMRGGASLPKRETIRGVDVRRIWTTGFGRGSLLGRAIDYLTFYASAFFAMRRERKSLIVAMTDPPLLSIVATVAAPNVLNWVQDLFPEVAQHLGVKVPRFVNRIRDWSLRRARVNVALGEAMAKKIAGKSVVQHNWAGADLTQAGSLRYTGEFVVGYSGNLGRAHEFETMLAAARALPDIRFDIAGGGAQLDRVRANAPANVTFRDYAPREKLGESLSSASVQLVSLLPALEGLIVPSKFYGILAVGRPVIFIGARDSELAQLIGEHGCGYAVEPGDAAGLIAAIDNLSQDRAHAVELGRRGRALYDARFTPDIAFANWERILTDAAPA
ncbi:MAG TPA: glycosyltransferase family 4 protein [Thermoanaerobaculia bacterium]|nr:glycosyltransferase family 4 protein [Thermoanaerobaculia bacterium]